MQKWAKLAVNHKTYHHPVYWNNFLPTTVLPFQQCDLTETARIPHRILNPSFTPPSTSMVAYVTLVLDIDYYYYFLLL